VDPYDFIVEAVSVLATLTIATMNGDDEGYDLVLAPYADDPAMLRHLLRAAIAGNVEVGRG